MVTSNSFLIGLLVVWAVVTTFWVVLMIYRGVVGLREEDQVFLHKGEESMIREQKEIGAKLDHLRPHLIWSGVSSIILIVVLGLLFLYRGWTGG
ncbi:MAG: hypothetical protein PHX83_15390 [Acidobacteriia bacterium]|nr:hypothetical protein [Terriglobia bacterium]